MANINPKRDPDRFTIPEKLDYYNNKKIENQAIITKINSYSRELVDPHSIKHLQDLLNKHVIGYRGDQTEYLELDGILGNETLKYLKEYQALRRVYGMKAAGSDFTLNKKIYDVRNHPNREAVIDSIYQHNKDMYDGNIHWGDYKYMEEYQKYLK